MEGRLIRLSYQTPFPHVNKTVVSPVRYAPLGAAVAFHQQLR